MPSAPSRRSHSEIVSLIYTLFPSAPVSAGVLFREIGPVARIPDCQSGGASSILVSPALPFFPFAWRGDVVAVERFRQPPLGIGLVAMIAGCQPAGAGSIPVSPTKASGWKAHACSLTYWLNVYSNGDFIAGQDVCGASAPHPSCPAFHTMLSVCLSYAVFASGAVGIRSFDYPNLRRVPGIALLRAANDRLSTDFTECLGAVDVCYFD